MTIRALLAAALAVAAIAGAAEAAGWRTYVNERFGATADVPADWQPGEPPANGDGLEFRSPDGKATIAVYGSFNSLGTKEEMNIYASPNEGETITYQKRGKTWVVVSGIAGDRIFYRRTMLSCQGQIWNGVAIEYPAAEKKEYDALVAHVAGSLRGGTGWQSEGCR
ncbi:MAG TPA: hypothetical protein VFB16_06800 [Bauldia sp.]|nr:hypothetical protein [Bauldia sp.]